MRRVHNFLIFILLLCGANASAQVYSAVTATNGTQVVAGGTITVNVTQSTPPPNTSTTLCVGPYQVGRTYRNYYNYNFPNQITHARLRFIRVHDDDTLRVEVDGSLYTITPAMLNNFGAACPPAYTTNSMTTPGGMLSTDGGAVGNGQGVELIVTAPPNKFTNLRVWHYRHPDNIIASDVVYSLEVADDSCALGITATVDSPACSGRDIMLSATDFPNTTYTWTTNAPIQPTFSPSNNVREPKLLNVNQGNSGLYTVTATRGACTYTTSINVIVNQSPVTGTPIQTGPVCPNENDTIKVPLVNLPTGGVVVAYGAWGRDTFNTAQGYIKVFNNVQASDAGLYNIYAAGTQGCLSDTFPFIFDVNPDVSAGFTQVVKEGCVNDTAEFMDASSAGGGSAITGHTWTFGDGSPVSNASDPTHFYTVPQPNYTSRDYPVRLIVTNGKCSDTSNATLTINHPVKAYYSIDDDSICQGTEVVFNDAQDSSLVKAGTTPLITWHYGEGTTDSSNSFTASYTYNNAGVYTPRLVITDYLGCADSYSVTVVVDSGGFVNIAADRDAVCLGEEVILTGEYSTSGYVSAIWNLGDDVEIPDSNLIYHSYNQPGVYDITFDIDYRICDDVQATAQIVVKPFPELYLGPDTAICPGGEPVLIQDIAPKTSPGNVTYSWNTPTKDVTPGIYVRHQGKYAVTANLDGCIAMDTVEVKKNCYINIPNAFTPNNDGQSDYFLPRQMLARNVAQFEMQIYNRWGEQVFETNGLNGRGWDGMYGGEPQPTGVYIYTIDVTFGNGYTERYQGNVTLLR